VVLAATNRPETATRMPREHRGSLDWLAGQLMEHETVDGATVLEALRRENSFVPPHWRSAALQAAEGAEG
jgi:hypothetical protein